MLPLLLLTVAGACRVARKWLQHVQVTVYAARWYMVAIAIYCGLFFLLVFDFNTRYFFTPSSGYFVINSNHVPFSANTVTELLASRRYKQISVKEWRFMPDDRAFALHPVVHTIKNDISNNKNIVLFIIESASGEDFQENEQRRNIMPFLDSLMKQSLVFDNFYANCLSSPAGFDAIIGGIPEGSPADFFLTGMLTTKPNGLHRY